ncbi:MAG: hypothetical protein AB8I08_16740 [Sandaracinaceae bacterium]
MHRFSLRSALPLHLIALVALAGCDDGRGGPGPIINTDAGSMRADGGGGPTVDSGTTPPPPPGGAEPGAACNCDTDCGGSTTHAGICVQGVCMNRASAACASAGSATECPSGSRCWGLDGFEGGICFPDCASHTCAGTCDADGSCLASESMSCDASCGAVCSGGGSGGSCPPNAHMQGDGCACDAGFVVDAAGTGCERECTMDTECEGSMVCVDNSCRTPPCTAGSCDAGLICADSGDCVVDIGSPPPGPAPSCAAGVGSVPDWRCTSGCGELVPFAPDMGPGYWDYPLNGETDADQYRSYVRRDVMMLVKYATAMVACQSASWTVGNGEPLGLGDMSEADGSIPGTREGSPGHPAGTHVNGHDMDIAYYQTGSADNRLRAVCEHRTGGADQYHCTGEPTSLDPWRTAAFLGHLHITPNLRVIGVDGRIGPIVESALSQLCTAGYVSGTACTSNRITYEVTDGGAGWYRFHHHHLHVSISG